MWIEARDTRNPNVPDLDGCETATSVLKTRLTTYKIISCIWLYKKKKDISITLIWLAAWRKATSVICMILLINNLHRIDFPIFTKRQHNLGLFYCSHHIDLRAVLLHQKSCWICSITGNSSRKQILLMLFNNDSPWRYYYSSQFVNFTRTPKNKSKNRRWHWITWLGPLTPVINNN